MNNINKIIYASLILLIIVHPSCTKDEPILNDNGAVVSLNPNWTSYLHDDGEPLNSSYTNENLVHGNNPIINITDGNGNSYISEFDIDNGEEIWRWNDTYNGTLDISRAYIYGDFMWFQRGKSSYTVDLENGTTLRKEQFNETFDLRITGIENKVFLLGRTNLDSSLYAQYGYDADLQTGEKELSVIPTFSKNYITNGGLIGAISNFTAFVENGDTMLSVVYAEPMENWYIDSYLGLYNFSKNEWIYDRVSITTPTQSNAISHFPIIREGKVYMSMGREIVCHDLYTGEQIWKEVFPRDFLFSGFIVEDGRVVANCEDKVLYCLDANTGNQLWRNEGAATASRLRYLNGIVYFSGGYIFAVEVATGKQLWRLDANLVEKGTIYFKTDFYVIPNKNKVVVTTGENAYCFDAIR